MESIPARLIVRSFVACRVTRPEDYSPALRREYGLDEIMHSSFVRRIAALLEDYPELQAQVEGMSDADDDEWLNDERTPHADVEAEEAEEWEAEETQGGGSSGFNRGSSRSSTGRCRRES